MSKNKNREYNQEDEKARQDFSQKNYEMNAVEVADDLQEAADQMSDADAEVVEAVEVEAEQLREELAKEKENYLFLRAEFDNFRKRTLKEKGELVKSASSKVIEGLLPIVDDFERGIDANKSVDDAEAIKQGMELIYNKLVSYLERNGLKPIESTGKPFDPDMHEAIAMVPAPTEEQKGQVIDTPSKGYTLNDKVLRHAKVVVGQ